MAHSQRLPIVLRSALGVEPMGFFLSFFLTLHCLSCFGVLEGMGCMSRTRCCAQMF